MPPLDLRTILIEYVFGNLICAIVLTSLWRQNRTRYSGLEYWMYAFYINLVGIAFLAGRGILPDFVSILLGSIFLVMGTFLLYVGCEKFFLDRGVPGRMYFTIMLYIFLQVYFIYIQPDLQIRNILFSGVLVIFSVEFGWLLFHKVPPIFKPLQRNLGIITSIFGVLALFRIIFNIWVFPGTNLMNSAGYEAVLYLAFQMMYILLTVTFFQVVNHRLFIDLEHDAEIRRKIEEALRVSQEKYQKAFQASPDAILITRITDGKIIEVNDSFCRITGYSREEAIQYTTVDLGLWVNLEDREEYVRKMQKDSRISKFLTKIRLKTGHVLHGEISAESIQIGDEQYLLTIFEDVSERQRMENILKVRLRIWEYSLSHDPIEVMEKALDELEDLTGSQIGFYHLVDEDSNNLFLQAWSTRTKEDYCKAEGSGMHYSIDQAGVWVDCIRERRPLIHNNYAALSYKKGLPEGHAALIRELVVPIFQDDKIVSILGVGNKPTDYDERDIELVDYMANLVWSIVEKIRNEEKIRELNERLELLAMTDELTGLPNRRSFFLRGAEEISRAKRYRNPLSLIIMDLDKFKTINDSYGHDMGDKALKCVANILRQQSREVDLPARLGGEEFGVILPNTRLEDAVIVADRIRMAIEALKCALGDKPALLTGSFGVAALKTEIKDLDTLFHNADTAMYQAKDAGRNRVVIFD